MLTAARGTVSSRPLTVNRQVDTASDRFVVLKTPLPDVTKARCESKGSISIEPAQWIA